MYLNRKIIKSICISFMVMALTIAFLPYSQATASSIISSSYEVKALVKNLSFNKDIKVRYTTDGWKTVKEESLSYVKTNDNGDEIWSCKIDTVDSNSKTFKYALSYTVGGQTYWDNNFGQNYDDTYRHSYI